MIYKIQFDYRQLTPENQIRLAEVIPSITFHDGGYIEYSSRTHYVDEKLLPLLMSCAPCDCEPFKYIGQQETEPLEESKVHAPVINVKNNFVQPGNELMRVKDVTVKYDLCTDALKDFLTEGWMILAICPQPDQRRPDYILGRYDARL